MILIGCSSGVVALVGDSAEEDEAFTRLTHPKPVVALQPRAAHPLLLTGESEPTEEATEEPTEEATEEAVTEEVVAAPVVEAPRQAEPPKPVEKEVSKSLPRKDILPCSCCRKTMKVPSSPHVAPTRTPPTTALTRKS